MLKMFTMHPSPTHISQRMKWCEQLVSHWRKHSMPIWHISRNRSYAGHRREGMFMLAWLLARKLAGMLDEDARPGCWLHCWTTETLGPSLADLQGAVCPCSNAAHSGGSKPGGEGSSASESQLCDYQLFLSSLLFLPSLPSFHLSHAHARTRARAHTHTHTRIHVRPRVHELILPMAGRLGGIISP